MSLKVIIKKKFKGFFLDVEFETEESEETEKKILGILGASGCGKSMTLKCIAGTEKPDSGYIALNDTVFFDSERNINLSPQKRKIGYLFQNYALFPNMTVEENVGIGIEADKQEKGKRVSELIQLLHLNGLERHYPKQLSGGQQQRTALARIIAYQPRLFLLDEPFSALDSHLKEQLQMQLLKVFHYYQVDTLMVSHSRDEIYKICNNMMIMEQGKVILTGKTMDVFHSPNRLIAARLTGCKNISKIQKVSDYELVALDWNICLKTADLITESIGYVGIRARSILVEENKDQENIIRCQVKEISEGPFELDYMLYPDNYKENGQQLPIWWKVNKKTDGAIYKKEDYVYIRIPKDAVMLLEE